MAVTIQDLHIDYDSPNWCPGCVIPTTRIQTNPSSKLITEIMKDSKVLSDDGKAHLVTEIMSHIHNGSVYRIVSKYFGETTLTPEHPILAVKRKHKKLQNKEFRSEWIEAADLQKGDYLLYPILKEIRDVPSIPLTFSKKKKDTRSKVLPDILFLTSDFLLLAGYYIAEGNVHRGSINFTFHKKEVGYADEVIRIMQETFHVIGEKKFRKNKKTIDLSFNSSYLAEMFEEWFGKGALNKKVPDFLMFLPKEKQKELLKGLWRGDGYVQKEKHRASYKTISKVLSEQVKMLLLRQGILPIISINKAYSIHHELYAIQIKDPYDFSLILTILCESEESDFSHRTRELITSEYAFLPIKKIEKREYHGPIYNFEVETENAYVTENAILHNCGDFGIWMSLKKAIVELQLNPWEVVLISGIGCSSKLPYWVKTYGFNGLHGRPIPPAEAIKLANHGLTVIVIGGDGDQFGEGMSHWLHAARRNVNITLIIHNNQIYGLTTGQFSPTTDEGEKNKATPVPTVEMPVNPEALAIATGATFVARGFAGDTKLETQLIVEGIKHKGFTIIDSMQPCVTFNHKNTYQWFYDRIYNLQETEYNPYDLRQAMEKAQEWPLKKPLPAGEKERIPVGLLYKENRPTWEDGLPQIKDIPLVKQSIKNIDISPLLEELM